MAFTPKFVDLVRNVATVTGTGPVTLGTAVNGYSSLAAAVAAGEQFYYCIQGIDKPTEREIGRGTMQADGRVARQAIAGALTNFTGGTKTIALVAAAEWFATLDQLGAAAPAGVANRAELAAKPASGIGAAILREAGREGSFLFDTSNLAARVTADAAQGIYVAPASDPTGASGTWVRKFSGPVDPSWFGLSTANTGAQNDAAILAMFAALRARSAKVGNWSRAVEDIKFPTGLFNFASTIEVTDGNWHISGSGSINDDSGTILKFPAGVTGIRVQTDTTTGATGTRASEETGGRSIIRDLVVDGAYTATEAEAHGIHLRGRAYIKNVIVTDFQGDGVHIEATATSDQGNANLFLLEWVRCLRNRTGFYVDGADANAGSMLNCDATTNRRWGFADSSFLGNSYIACHSDSNGNQGGPAPSACSHGGNRYSVIAGQEAGAATNAPSGTTADNAWWGYLAAGGVSAVYPAWVSGITVRAGGAYHSDNLNARNLYLGCYSESGQNPSQFSRPTIIMGGLHAAGVKGTGAYLRMGATAGVLEADGFGSSYVGASSFTARLGEQGVPTALYITDSVAGAAGWRLRLNGSDLQFDYGNGSASRAYCITGPNTTQQFGTGAGAPHALYVPHLVIGDLAEGAGNGRRIAIDTAAPTTGAHGQGEIIFNRTAAAGQPMGWICTVAGTPGTWLPLANIP